jgi:4-hydroxybenzoate polyprenyltransferase
VVLVSYMALNILGILIGAFLGAYILLMHILSAVLLWLYSLDLKRRPFIGNLIIGLLTGAAILIVGVFYMEISGELLLYSGFAFFFTLVREIVKDMEDLKGDRTFGCKTLPVIWGYRGTKKFIFLLSILFIAGIVLLAIQVRHTPLTWVVTGILPITIMYNVRLYRSDTKKAFAHLSTLSKYIMILGITTMILFK